MMKHALLLSAALFYTAVGAAPTELFLRGGFNGWGTDNPLLDKGDGIVEATLAVGPGNHGFKVGSRDWSTEWVIDPKASVAVVPGADYRMASRPGPEDTLFVRTTATYRFTLDVPHATLRVAKLDMPPAVAAAPHTGALATWKFATYDGKSETASFSTPDANAPLRSYVHSTSMQLRDPGRQFVRYQEAADLPVVRSGNLAFDALFALAIAEMRQDSVGEIRDGNYNGGAPIPCDCFETGEKWHYVWTRDLSYAANLGLAMLDPQRVMHSLDFKVSPFRAGFKGGPQIVQDTGSGGSWPVSTDRVSWAFGAEAVLKSLPPAERDGFAARALEALTNTIESDRLAAFNPATGLYTGEQSFLDWREQSYAAWIGDDLSSMASSMALSTNVAHFQALTLAASLSTRPQAAKYTQWAAALKKAINERLWLADAGMYSSLTAGHFDGAPLHKFDWLGQALAIVTGVADPVRARSILAHYPHGPMGAPVIYPQQRGQPIYHNRAIWPFGTAYGLKAARIAGNVSVADAAYETLMRGAALNLSNMENLEWLSGQPLLLDERNPSLIGPVINSRRQLWSVGAYLGMVIQDIFGVGAERPFITAKLRREVFGQSDIISLERLRVGGKLLTVRIHLPPAVAGDGYYPVASRTTNGDTTDIHLGELVPGEQAITRVVADPYAEDSAVFAPSEPRIDALATKGGKVVLNVSGAKVYNVYRDGKLAASGVTTATWSERATHACYAVEAQDGANRSHHSAPQCSGESIAVTGDRITIQKPGRYQIQLRYRNTANQINLGISNGVKWLTVLDAGGHVVGRQIVQMPHTHLAQAYSTPMAARLKAGSYRLVLTDFYNMSYLQSNSTFSGAGGAEGPSNRFDLFGVRLLRVN